MRQANMLTSSSRVKAAAAVVVLEVGSRHFPHPPPGTWPSLFHCHGHGKHAGDIFWVVIIIYGTIFATQWSWVIIHRHRILVLHKCRHPVSSAWNSSSISSSTTTTTKSFFGACAHHLREEHLLGTVGVHHGSNNTVDPPLCFRGSLPNSFGSSHLLHTWSSRRLLAHSQSVSPNTVLLQCIRM